MTLLSTSTTTYLSTGTNLEVCSTYAAGEVCQQCMNNIYRLYQDLLPSLLSASLSAIPGFIFCFFGQVSTFFQYILISFPIIPSVKDWLSGGRRAHRGVIFTWCMFLL